MENLKRPATLLNLILIVLLAFLLYRDCEGKVDTDNIVDYTKVQSQLISNDKVFEFYKDYDNKGQVVSEYVRNTTGRRDFNDTRTILFDFDVLDGYLDYIKEVSKNKGVTPEGIKITFGSYKNNGNFPSHTNVFLTPTKRNKNTQSAYTISDGKIVFFKDLKEKPNVQKGGFLSFNIFQNEGLGLNGGTPIPPPHSEDPDFN